MGRLSGLIGYEGCGTATAVMASTTIQDGEMSKPSLRSPSLAYVVSHLDQVEDDDIANPQLDSHDEASSETSNSTPPKKSWHEIAHHVILFVVLGASGWWSNNTINNENPVFVQMTPERNRFPALASFACQIGNLFPIVYKSVTGFCLSDTLRRRIIAPTVYIGLISGAAVLAVCALFWRETVVVDGQRYSGILLLCCVLSGGIGCMSNVTYWAFASRYPVYCTKAMSTGMTFGGLLGSAIILGQNAGCDPYFSTEYYFLAGVGIQLVMLVGTLPILNFQEQHSNTSKPEPKLNTRSRRRSNRRSRSASFDPELSPLLERSNVSVNASTVDEKMVQKITHATPAYVDANGLILCILCFSVYGCTYALAPMMPYVLKGYESPSFISGNTTSMPNLQNEVKYVSAPQQTSAPWEKPVSLMPYSERGGIRDPVWLFNSSYGTQEMSNKKGSYLTDSNHGCNTSTSSSHDLLYRWVIVSQQVGDISGRVSTAFGTPKELKSLLGLGGAAISLFTLFCIGTAYSNDVPRWLPGNYGYVIPVLLLFYYFLRGFCVTSSYVWVKMNMTQRDAEKLSSNLGMMGQLGALSGNILMVLLTYFVLQPP